MRTLKIAAAALCAMGLCAADSPARDHRKARIVWDESTRALVQRGGVYGRMARLANGEILCAFEWAGRVWVRRSADEGKTWSDPRQVVEYPFGNAANPELLVLKDGSVLLFYNERPRDRVHPFTIRSATSRDHGLTWSEPVLHYEAGTTSQTGCWEPAAIQLPSGEIQLFFANEKPYPETNEQEITMLRSADNGATWSDPQRVGFRAGFRDGMPVPLVLANGAGIVVAIEDNGMAGRFKPAVLFTPAEDNWTQGEVTGDSDRRWAALEEQLPAPVYAGAPYIRQFPSGETVLSIQSAEDRNRIDTHTVSRMVVYIGDSSARNFTGKSIPFDVPPDTGGLWNSLFIKNERTVTAISSTVVDGVRGLWAIDGYLEYQEN